MGKHTEAMLPERGLELYADDGLIKDMLIQTSLLESELLIFPTIVVTPDVFSVKMVHGVSQVPQHGITVLFHHVVRIYILKLIILLNVDLVHIQKHYQKMLKSCENISFLNLD